MTEQTGNDRYAGTSAPQRQSQSQPAINQHNVMGSEKQAGAQLESPQNQPRDQDDDARRQQAGAQSDKGFGYGAEDGDEMAEAPDASTDGNSQDDGGDAPKPSDRGYGGAAEEREEKLDKD